MGYEDQRWAFGGENDSGTNFKTGIRNNLPPPKNIHDYFMRDITPPLESI